jgi:hypothetical protein
MRSYYYGPARAAAGASRESADRDKVQAGPRQSSETSGIDLSLTKNLKVFRVNGLKYIFYSDFLL